MSQFSFVEGFFPDGPVLDDELIFEKGIPVVAESQTLPNDYIFWANQNWFIEVLYLFTLI
jgi:hypothetical protein